MRSRPLSTPNATTIILGLVASLASGCSTGPTGGQPIAAQQLAIVSCGSSPNEIRGCVDSEGEFRLLVGGVKACDGKKESSICWNQVGPSGSNALVTTEAAPASVCQNGDRHASLFARMVWGEHL
jgi:hypothetical protein